MWNFCLVIGKYLPNESEVYALPWEGSTSRYIRFSLFNPQVAVVGQLKQQLPRGPGVGFRPVESGADAELPADGGQ